MRLPQDKQQNIPALSASVETKKECISYVTENANCLSRHVSTRYLAFSTVAIKRELIFDNTTPRSTPLVNLYTVSMAQ